MKTLLAGLGIVILSNSGVSDAAAKVFQFDPEGTLTNGLTSYWKLDESSGNAADSMGSNTLTNNNAATYAIGKVNNGVNLIASSNQFLRISDASQSGLDITGSLTISAWVKVATTSFGMIVNKYRGDNNGRSYQFYWTGTKLSFDIGSGPSSEYVEYSQSFNAGTWYHVVGVFDASTSHYEILVNGSSIGSATKTYTSIYHGDSSFFIGSDDAAHPFDGMIDEVGVWSRALSGSEITRECTGTS